MKKYFLPLALTACFSTISFAEDYQFDVAGVIAKEDLDNLNVDSTVIAAGIQYHFKGVDTSQGPLAEAGYLNKSSNISALQMTDISGDADVDVTILSGEIYIPNTMFYLKADHAIFDGGDDSTTTLHFGLTPIDGLLLTTYYNDDTDYQANINAKYYLPLTADNSMVFRGGLEDSDDFGNTLTVGADYYFNQRTGIGFNLSDNDDFSQTEIHATHFFMEDAYAGISFTDTDNQNVIALTGGFRF